MKKHRIGLPAVFLLFFIAAGSSIAACQTLSLQQPSLPFQAQSGDVTFGGSPSAWVSQPSLGGEAGEDSSASGSETGTGHGWLVRNLARGLEDQKGIWLAPFKPANFKWDALLLVSTGVLIATDRQTSRALPTGHVQLFRNITNISLGSTAAAAGGIWVYGIKKDNQHARETGELELETLANTFLVYTPMQFIAGRERPEEGTGNGRFWRHGGFNTSFPAGHPMFTWAMATVLAHEYPRPWVKFLSYGAATAVSMGRFLGREHFASDVLVGSVLGYAIATHIFHTRCDPQRSDACTR